MSSAFAQHICLSHPSSISHWSFVLFGARQVARFRVASSLCSICFLDAPNSPYLEPFESNVAFAPEACSVYCYTILLKFIYRVYAAQNQHWSWHNGKWQAAFTAKTATKSDIWPKTVRQVLLLNFYPQCWKVASCRVVPRALHAKQRQSASRRSAPGQRATEREKTRERESKRMRENEMGQSW